MPGMLAEPPPTQYDLRWRMLGMPIRVHPLFWLVTLVFGWRGAAGRWDLILAWIGCVFVSILVHEFGHALVARACGATGVRVVLYAMGGLAIHEGGTRRWQRIVELLMGPGAGFLLAGLTLLVSSLVLPRLETVPFIVHVIVMDLLLINIFWGIVNLLPVYPLDGGQVTWEVLDARRRRERRVLTHKISIGVALLVVAGALGLDYGLHLAGDGWFPAILFGLLAFDNYRLMQVAKMPGWAGDEAPREPWEQDPDWWKR